MSLDTKQQLKDFQAAHFFLGFEQNKDSTNYKDEYVPKQQLKEFPNTEEAKQFEKYIKNPRKAHFELGEDNVNYDSIQKTSFDPKADSKAQLPEETKKDLRSHHFQLGFHSVPSETEYSGYKALPKVAQDVISQSRKHHHDFGDQKTYFKTTYSSTNIAHKVLEKEKQEYVNEIRKSNIQLGKGQTDYVTNYNQYHAGTQNPERQSLNNQLTKFLKESHLTMGDAKSVKYSQTKDIYKGDQPEHYTKIAKETLDDLRKAHFDLSYQKADMPTTTQRSTFQTLGIQMSQPKLQLATLNLGTTGYENERYFDTGYKNTYINYNASKPELLKDPRLNSIEFGDEGVEYISEQKRNFPKYNNPERVGLNKDLVSDIRDSHLVFGEDKVEYPVKEQAKKKIENQLSPELLKDLRKEHFVTGFKGTDYLTHNSEYGLKQGPPNQLDQELQNNLRKHHFIEDGETNYKTSYQSMRQS